MNVNEQAARETALKAAMRLAEEQSLDVDETIEAANKFLAFLYPDASKEPA